MKKLSCKLSLVNFILVQPRTGLSYYIYTQLHAHTLRIAELQIQLRDITITHRHQKRTENKTQHRMEAGMKPVQKTHEESSSICDLNIIVEGEQYGAHWRILREKCKFFDEFYGRKNQKKKSLDETKTCLHLKGVSSRLVGQLLQYVYTSCSKNNKKSQLELHDINEVLKFGIMFGLKDLESSNRSNLELEAQLQSLDNEQRMSNLHVNLLRFLYGKTASHKTSDLAKFVAHKAYTSANMECLFDVLKVVSGDSLKMMMRLRLLDILITLFTNSLEQEVMEGDMKGSERLVADLNPNKPKECGGQKNGTNPRLCLCTEQL